MTDHPQGRKAEILDTALALAFEGGPNRVTTVAIAERLGLTQPAIYRHFRSKADLWAAITDRLGAEVGANMARVEAMPGPALERLRALVLGHLALIQRTPALPEIMLARDPGSADAVVRVAMQARMAAFQKMLTGLCDAAQAEGAMRRNISARDLAALIMGVLQSLVLRLLLSRNPDLIVEDGERLLDLQIAAFARESES
ncbi:TetR/AcrR family transcriptional regulator [Sinisalibacter aestuarii]|uniref:TetR family transcriptional regulator n=1 Tax=Sinisalibacter aestuarii TaxID=2949426 RepID=A0ABQ5LVU7_9RHOB|nr:TetR/AcrR family transcriptional regulator [Sinisalibacter aestuarii]GKY89120.1 TetR family transcriptional regulator [Sinisalibacter aestuarii]